MSTEALTEELEVLDSIYPTELSKLSDNEIEIIVEPDEKISGVEELRLSLNVAYPDSYPDVLPRLSLHILNGTLEDQESEGLIEELKAVGEENLGMAMTFTLISHLRENLLTLLQNRTERKRREEAERERLEIEAEEARTQGTPVTLETFLTWKSKFDKEMATRRAAEQEDRSKGLPTKERDELRKIALRLTGRQLFERDHDLATSDATLVEEGTISIDISQFDRTTSTLEVEEDEGLQFSDSD